MTNWVAIRERDYKLSKRLASILSYDGNSRKIVQIFTFTGTAFFWYIALTVFYFVIPEYRSEIYTIFFVTTFMLIPVALIKNIVKRPRPDFKDTRLGAVVFDHWSFPSGHATRGTYLSIVMGLLFPAWSWFWILYGALILLSRLLIGVHFISDIIAGFLLSCASMTIFYLLDWLPIAPFSPYAP